MVSVARTVRSRLGLDELVVAAEAIVDRDGWEQLTMTALAAEVGVKVPSLYNHVPGLEALRGAIQVRTMKQLASELRSAAMGRSGIDGYRALAGVHRSFAARHPHRYEGLTRAPVDRDAYLVASAAGAAEAIAAMVGGPPTADPDFSVELAAFAALHGFIALERSGFFGDAVDADRVFALVVEGAIATMQDQTGAHRARRPRGNRR